jgi:hypothetical protein
VLLDAQTTGRPYLERVKDLVVLCDNVHSAASKYTDPRLVSEIEAHCFLLRGDAERAKVALDDLITQLEPPSVPYEVELLQRVRELRDRLEESSVAASALLESWESETRSGLGLPEMQDLTP